MPGPMLRAVLLLLLQLADRPARVGAADTCVEPGTEGYAFATAHSNLTIAGFAVPGLACATHWHGDPAASACSAHGQPYVVSGCVPDACTTPHSTAGYDFTNTAGSSSLIKDFTVPGLACATHWHGDPAASVCAAHGQP